MDDFFNLSDISAQNEEQLNDSMRLIDKIDGKDQPEEHPILEIIEETTILQPLEPIDNFEAEIAEPEP